MNKRLLSVIILLVILAVAVCTVWLHVHVNTADADVPQEQEVPVTFDADSAYAFCQAQCDFGPRTMNSRAHELCADYICQKFSEYGMTVERQQADLKGYDGTVLHATNIIARFRPDATDRILVCAHWDSRPWADNDPDESNWHTPVMAANDGASGVAVMLELARLLSLSSGNPGNPGNSGNSGSSGNSGFPGSSGQSGVDFVCFDAEDWGTPQWDDDGGDNSDTWALGAQHWAQTVAASAAAKPRYGILLDMVGGQGACFFREGFSIQRAPDVLRRVWRAAKVVGYGSFFSDQAGNHITDDHLPVNDVAGIPTIDIIPFYPDCERSSFGPTWHTVDDDMPHIDRNTLRAVGQTLVQVLFTEN